MPRSPSSLVAVASALLLVAAAGAWFVRSRTPDAPTLRLSEVEGDVDLRGVDGDRDALSGVLLAPADRLSTGEDGRAVLQLGDETRVVVEPASTVQVVAVDVTGVSLELEGGALRATVRPTSGAVRVANRGRSVLATDGAFDVGVRNDVLQVAVRAGEAAVDGGAEGGLRVAAGQQVTVADRRAQLAQIPEELLLAVAWPAEPRTRETTGAVEGRTAPGATVHVRSAVGEVVAVADADGTFRATIALAEGENRVVVESVDALGNRTALPGVLVRDTQGPRFRAGVEYGPP